MSLQQPQATTSNIRDNSTVTQVINEEEQQQLSNKNNSSSGTLRLHLTNANVKKPELRRRVSWTENTVDNESLGKKKSKCCCVYVKPHTVNIDENNDGASSSEDEEKDPNLDDECAHCNAPHRKKDYNSKRDPKSKLHVHKHDHAHRDGHEP